jgi:hypothetical protein
VVEYKLYVVGEDGHFEGVRAYLCDTDDDAVVWAQHMRDDRAVELWSGARLVKRLDQRKEPKASSHEIHRRRLVPQRGT